MSIKINITETSNANKNCMHCEYFNSWAMVYEDELDDHESGLCGYSHGGYITTNVSSQTICEKFKRKKPRAG